jgi:hypothetical protein
VAVDDVIHRPGLGQRRRVAQVLKLPSVGPDARREEGRGGEEEEEKLEQARPVTWWVAWGNLGRCNIAKDAAHDFPGAGLGQSLRDLA